MRTPLWINIFVILLVLTRSIKCQDNEDEEDDEDYEEEKEESAVKAKEESGKLTDAPPATTPQFNILPELLRQSAGNGSATDMNQALLNMLILATMTNNANNANQPAAASTVVPVTTEVPEVETEEPSSTTREEYVVGQIGKIMDSVMRANISGIVDNAVRIGAPPSVVTMMSNIMVALNNISGGVFGIRLDTRTTARPGVDCGRTPGTPGTATVTRQPQTGQVSRPPISPAASAGGTVRYNYRG